MQYTYLLLLIISTLIGCQKAKIEENTLQSTPSPDWATLTQQLQQSMEDNQLLGLSVLLVKGGDVVYDQGFGIADFERNIPVDTNTVYRIASISKTITAVAAMQLQEQGKVQLDADVSEYLGFTVRNPKFPDQKITLHHLLNHQSSIRDGKGYSQFSRNMFSNELDIRQLFVEGEKYYTEDLFANHEPGAFFSYTNCTWGLIASIVERVSGQRFDVYCRENIFKPLAMGASFNVVDIENIDQMAVLYRFQDSIWTAQADDYKGQRPESRVFDSYTLGQNGLLFGPQGSLRASANDLAKFALMLMNDGKGNGQQILKPETLALMSKKHWEYNENNGDTWDRFWFSYGYGLHHLTNRENADVIFKDHTMSGHPGIAYGLVSDMYYDKEKKNAIVFITNGCKTGYEYAKTSTFYQPEASVFELVAPFMN